MDKQQVTTLLYSTDEYVGSVLTFTVLIILTKSVYIALGTATIVYGLLWLFTKPPIIEPVEPVEEVAKPNTTVIFAPKKKPKPHKLGDVKLNNDFTINLLRRNTFLAAQTQFGKTSLINSMLLQLHNGKPNLQVALIDLKRVSFNIFTTSPLLFNEVYTTQEGVIAIHKELVRRQELFLGVGGNYIVANINKYNKVRPKGTPKLLPLVVFVDEVQKLIKVKKIDYGAILQDVVRTGLAFGIYVVASSQRTTSESITPSALAQYSNRLIGVMETPNEYVYAKVDKELATEMLTHPVEGRFIVKYKGKSSIIQTDFVPDERIEQLASTWPVTQYVELQGTTTQKNTQVLKYLNTLDKKPTIVQFRERYGTDEDTTRRYLKLWQHTN